MPTLAVSLHGEAIGGAAVRQVVRCSHRIVRRLAFALADEVGMDAVGTETRDSRSEDDVGTAQHFAQPQIMPATSGMSDGAQGGPRQRSDVPRQLRCVHQQARDLAE